MTGQPVNLREKLARFADHWAPRVVAELNDYQVKLAKVQGEFVWHDQRWSTTPASWSARCGSST